MRYLAIDPGEKRTGLALGDDITGLAQPLARLDAGDRAQRLDQLIEAIDAQGPDALVLGLPLNMDGTEGPAAAAARELGEALHQRTGLTVHLVDERLSSAEADERLADAGLSREKKKGRRDQVAAATILRDFLEGRGRHT